MGGPHQPEDRPLEYAPPALRQLEPGVRVSGRRLRHPGPDAVPRDLHARPQRPGPEVGSEGLLVQSPVRPRSRPLDAEGVRGVPARRNGRLPRACPHRYGVVARLRDAWRGPLHPWPPAVQREQPRRPVPVRGDRLQAPSEGWKDATRREAQGESPLLAFRISDETKQTLKEVAKLEDITPSEYARRALENALRKDSAARSREAAKAR